MLTMEQGDGGRTARHRAYHAIPENDKIRHSKIGYPDSMKSVTPFIFRTGVYVWNGNAKGIKIF